MSCIYLPSAGPDDWRALLADPGDPSKPGQWKTGYSARTLAHAWERADGLPAEIAAMFDRPSDLLLAIPEHKVPLRGRGGASQNDVFALIRSGERTCAATIEGKVDEPFGPTVGTWFANPSQGKSERMRYLCGLLGLEGPPPDGIRYQLMHRTASALIEADRFKTTEAAMIVHSFSQKRLWFDDFAAFLGLFGLSAEPSNAFMVTVPSGQPLRLGWATGDPMFLSS